MRDRQPSSAAAGDDSAVLGRVQPAPGQLDDLAIGRHRAALFVIDIQEKLCAMVPEEPRQQLRRNVCTLIAMARRFAMPIVVSQQYPRGLGATDPEVAAAFEGHDLLHRFDKVDFSACEAEPFAMIRESLGDDRSQWILTGIESHICVYQTARDLVARGETVHVVRDAVASRTRSNWQTGLELMTRAGAVVTSTETVLFDALGRAGSDDFKALARLVK